jgi:predicted DCC family thiol-disulfide oxidoreductase YuxK
MKDPAKEFGLVRMGGTIGWILAAWPFTFIFVDWAKVEAAKPEGFVAWLGTVLGSGLTGDALMDATKWTFIVAGIASLVLAAFSLLLPHTPAKKPAGQEESFAAFQAIRLLKHPFVLVLWLVTFIDAFVHNCYFNWTGGFLQASREAGGVGIAGNWVMPVMSVGQIAEILTMFFLGMTLKNLGWRWTMIVGILGHALRFFVYAFFPENQNLIILVQILHGICYAFFFATVYIFVDAYFPKDVRSSAQGLFNVMILGVGALVANSVCPWLMENVFTSTTVIDGVESKTVDFKNMFLFPSAVAALAAIALAVFFHPPKQVDATLDGASAPAH